MHALIEHVIIKHVSTLCRQGHSNFKKACMASGVAMDGIGMLAVLDL